MGITECRLRTNRTVSSNIGLHDYIYESEAEASEASTGETLMYIGTN